MLRVLVGITLCVAFGVAFMLSTTKADPLQPGASAPALKSVDQDGKPVDLGEALKKGLTLVYFYPKADTPGCTKEACGLRDKWEDVKKAGVTVMGVSMDTPEAQKAFKDKFQLPFTLLADTDGSVLKAFGVPKYRGLDMPTRQSFLIKDGKIVWHDPKVDAATHTDTVLKAVADLAKAPAAPAAAPAAPGTTEAK